MSHTLVSAERGLTPSRPPPVTTRFGSQGKLDYLTLNVNLEALITSMMLKAAQLMSYPSICNCWKDRHSEFQSHAEA